MSAYRPIPPVPTVPNPGGATVTDLGAMEGSQALSVMVLRDWFDGPQGRARVGATFAEVLGAAAAAPAIAAWTELGDLISDGTRRPVMRHAVTCRCVGADEAVIAQALSLAARGEREDAMLILSLLVAGDRLLPAVHVAQQAGLAVLRLATRWRCGTPAPAPTDTRHLH